MKRLFLLFGVVTLSLFITGCFDGGKGGPIDPSNTTRSEGLEYAPQMYHSIPYEPYTQLEYNNINPLGLNVRHAPENTVVSGQAYPELPYGDPVAMWKDADRMLELYDRSATELTVPDFVPNTPEVLAEGQRLYELYCDHCHGKKGEGDGPISKMEKIKVPSYLAPDRIDLSYGKMYFSTTYGKGAMGPHGSQVNAKERWQIVRYIRKLQGRTPEADAPSTQATEDAENTEETPTEQANAATP